jgi:hypothetical protein
MACGPFVTSTPLSHVGPLLPLLLDVLLLDEDEELVVPLLEDEEDDDELVMSPLLDEDDACVLSPEEFESSFDAVTDLQSDLMPNPPDPSEPQGSPPCVPSTVTTEGVASLKALFALEPQAINASETKSTVSRRMGALREPSVVQTGCQMRTRARTGVRPGSRRPMTPKRWILSRAMRGDETIRRPCRREYVA